MSIKNKLYYLGGFIAILFLGSCSTVLKIEGESKIFQPPVVLNESHQSSLKQPDLLAYSGSKDRSITIERRELGRYNPGFIESVNTLDTLFALYPRLKNDPGVNHPKFLELQRKIIYLNDFMGRPQDKEYLELREKKNIILEARPIWTSDLVEVDKKIRNMIGSGVTSSAARSELKLLLEQKSKLLNQLKEKDVFKEYIKSQDSVLQKIDSDIDTYLSSEVVTLRSEIEVLSKEVYGSGTLKK